MLQAPFPPQPSRVGSVSLTQSRLEQAASWPMRQALALGVSQAPTRSQASLPRIQKCNRGRPTSPAPARAVALNLKV